MKIKQKSVLETIFIIMGIFGALTIILAVMGVLS